VGGKAEGRSQEDGEAVEGGGDHERIQTRLHLRPTRGASILHTSW
jgi:hypothetical protein